MLARLFAAWPETFTPFSARTAKRPARAASQSVLAWQIMEDQMTTVS